MASFDGPNRVCCRLDVIDRVTPVCVLVYAVWTVYVHLLVFTESSFIRLLRFLVPVLLVAALAVVVWSRDQRRGACAGVADESCFTTLSAHVLRRWFVVGAIAWVVLYAVTRNFTLFWWGGVAALAFVWVSLSRHGTSPPTKHAVATQREAWGLVALCLLAAVVTSVANRPDIDDSLYLSIPATLIRHPAQPILLHDTLYRLPSLPIEFVAYREHTYEVLIAVVAWLTRLAPITVGHVVLPPLFAVLTVLAWAWLLRMLVPGHWLATLGLLLLCMLLLGETHHAYGNFGFVRLFQGKAIELCWSIPAVIGCALVWMCSGKAGDWLLLMAAQIAAIGITSTGLFVAPLAAGLALMGGWSATATASRRMVIGCFASWYVVVVGALLAVALAGEHTWSPDYATSMPPLGQMVTETWGYWSALPLLVALLAGWALCESRYAARVFATMALLFLLVCFNPYTYAFMADRVMGESALWRLSWVIPLPLMLAVLLRAILARGLELPVPWRGWKWAVWTVSGVVAVCGAEAAGTLRAANQVTLGVPGVKAPAADFALADRLVHEMPESSTLLAPVKIAVWCATFVRHPELLAVRPIYLLAVADKLGKADAWERWALQQYVSGRIRNLGSTELLKDGVSRYHLQIVVIANSASWAGEANKTMSDLDFRATVDGDYTVWRRPR